MNADELKKADEIVRALKECGDCDTCPYYDCWIDEHTGDPADACDEGRLFRDVIALIESLQAQLKLEHGGALAAAENCLRLQGEVNDLQTQLAAEKRRADRAVEDLAFACGSQPTTSDDCSICDICKYKQNDGSCPKQCFMNSLGASNRWQWRGPQEAEKGENNA